MASSHLPDGPHLVFQDRIRIHRRPSPVPGPLLHPAPTARAHGFHPGPGSLPAHRDPHPPPLRRPRLAPRRDPHRHPRMDPQSFPGRSRMCSHPGRCRDRGRHTWSRRGEQSRRADRRDRTAGRDCSGSARHPPGRRHRRGTTTPEPGPCRCRRPCRSPWRRVRRPRMCRASRRTRRLNRARRRCRDPGHHRSGHHPHRSSRPGLFPDGRAGMGPPASSPRSGKGSPLCSTGGHSPPGRQSVGARDTRSSAKHRPVISSWSV